MTPVPRFMTLFLAASLAPGVAGAGDRVLRAELDLPVLPAAAFEAWSTEAGVRSFFAPGANIEPRVDGAYEILFFPDAPAGQRGAEGQHVLAFEPPRRLAFTWNAPPSIPEVRGQHTVVVVEFEPLDAGRTRLRFSHGGWGEGPAWDKAYDYFDHAWSAVVLPRLVHRFAHGPLDWKNRLELAPVAATLKRELIERP